METKFQTSFIPKKPLIPETGSHVREPVNVFSLIGVLLFVVSIAAAGGMFAWTKILASQQQGYIDKIAHNRQQFGNDIAFLQRFNAKINLSRQLMNNHLAAADVFNILSGVTTDSVRLTSFDISYPTTAKDRALLNIKGEAKSFSALAFQSDVFGEGTLLKDPVVSDISLNDKGGVSFSLTASIDPKDMSFKADVAREQGTTQTDTAPTPVNP